MPMSTFEDKSAADAGTATGEIVYVMGGSGAEGAPIEEAIEEGMSRNQTIPAASPAMTVVAVTATA
jgi:hypothetical protein